MISNALRRLKASSTADFEVSGEVGPDQMVDAAFDQTKTEDLKTLQNILRRKGVIYKMSHHHLLHKTNEQDFDEDLKLTLEALHSMGHNPRIAPGVLTKTRFALKCTGDLVIQRIAYDLRLFFSAQE